MPLPWAFRGLRDGVVTSHWPARPDRYFDTFRAAVDVRADPDSARALAARGDELAGVCPTGAIARTGGAVSLDRGLCILCGRCVAAAPEVFAWSPGSATSVLDRALLVVGTPGDESGVEQVRAELARRVRRLRHSVHIRHVDAGSDGSDEWEVQALLNPMYDVNRLGIFFTASPRHADILLVTGLGTTGMAAPLRRTREAMPDPVVVIATGADAISGGILRESYSAAAGVGGLVDVDIWVPGSPASPFSLLHAILLALDRLPRRSAAASTDPRPDRDRDRAPRAEDQP